MQLLCLSRMNGFGLDSGNLCKNAVIGLNPVVPKVGKLAPGVICNFCGGNGEPNLQCCSVL